MGHGCSEGRLKDYVQSGVEIERLRALAYIQMETLASKKRDDGA